MQYGKFLSNDHKGDMHIIMSFGANAPPLHNMLNKLKNNKLGQNIS